LRDIRSTPIERAVPGVEVHAQLLESILTETLLTRPWWADTAEIAVTAGVGLILIAVLALVGAKLTLVLFLAVSGVLIAGSWLLFDHERILLDVAFPVITFFAIYVVATYLSYIQEQAQREQVRNAFSLYLSPAMVERVAANPSALKLGGEMRDMTIMFCDLRGFTTISEMYDAHGLTHLINAYLTPMTTIIQDTGGTVDKYIGDAIMAFWNAPLDVENHQAQAARALLGMRVGMVKLNEELKAEAEATGGKYVPLAIGIGLNSGVCCVGNMGSAQRLNYSVLGDAVNLAARLEGQSKTYHADNVIGETTWEGVQDFACLELDLIQVKGKTVPVRIHNVVGDEAMAREPEFQALKGHHDRMLAAYRGQRWDEADAEMDAAEALAARYAVAGIHEVYRERVAEMREDPPPADWDGVFVAKTK
jgi:adenylate cyclase